MIERIKDILIRIYIIFASIIVMAMAGGLIIVIHAVKIFRRIAWRDPFHDSRRHPLNAPDAPRG